MRLDAGFLRLISVSTRLEHTVASLLDLIAQFPETNPSQANFDDIDIPKLFGQIRARYKMLCTIVGVNPSLRASRANTQDAAGMMPSDKSSSVWMVATDHSPGSVDYSF